MHIEGMTIPDRFPPAPGKNLYAVIGLRTGESRSRLMGLFASKGYVTHANKYQVRNVRPIYDWSDGDVWKAICDNHWDYNSAYDVMARLGVKRSQLRIAPPAMNLGGAEMLGLAARAWPKWFDLVCQRLPGVRQAAHFGKRAAQPIRRLDETWEQCFQRTCIDTAPAWVADRARLVRDRKLSVHYHHSSAPFPEVTDCPLCGGTVRCWRKMTMHIYNGDPFSLKFDFLPYIEPEFFRPGAGTWGGSPAFS